MSGEGDSFNTPKRTKRLGLRRSNSTIKTNEVKKAVGSALRSAISDTGIAVGAARSQSDAKTTYKNLGQSGHVTTPDTPKTICCGSLRNLSISTNCRPYRLALSKKVRERMTKKRLEFYLANEIEKEDVEGKRSKKEEYQEEVLDQNTLYSKEDLIHLIKVAEKELTSRQQHMKKVQELQQAINVWKVGFSNALHDLQQKLEPRLETATLLDRLQIPQEMIKFIND